MSTLPLAEVKSHLSELVGAEVFVKYEGVNPTGSFKDRGMVVAVAKAAPSTTASELQARRGSSGPTS